MDEKVKATRDDPQGAPVNKSAEALRPPLKFGELPLFPVGQSAQACRISIVSPDSRRDTETPISSRPLGFDSVATNVSKRKLLNVTPVRFLQLGRSRSGLDESGARTAADTERPKSSLSERVSMIFAEWEPVSARVIAAVIFFWFVFRSSEKLTPLAENRQVPHCKAQRLKKAISRSAVYLITLQPVVPTLTLRFQISRLTVILQNGSRRRITKEGPGGGCGDAPAGAGGPG